MRKSNLFSARIISVVMAVIMLFTIFSVISVSATELLDDTAKVSVTLNCSKPGYEFKVYKVASLVSTTTNPYKTSYRSLVPAATSAINTGVTADILNALDGVNAFPSTSKVVGTFNSTATSVTKNISNLEQGIYYVRATNFPAGVKKITNSVFALPYYNGENWVYSIDDINLAEKVVDDTPSTEKTITNSTKGNVKFTDVSLGDTVAFSIKSTTAGSSSMKLNSYVIYDDMSAGLTLDNDSFNVALLKQDGTKIKDLATKDYKVNITKQKASENTTFNVALTTDYLQGEDFYAADVFYTDVTYTAKLNKYAVVGKAGNPNEDLKLEYSNKNNVKSDVEGNKVYVYTYAAKTNKYDIKGSALEGAKFSLFKTEENAQNLQGEIAKGVSDDKGLVKYYTNSGEEIRLTSGTYYAVETEAPEGFNLYGKVIKIEVKVEYGNTLVNDTYVTNCPEDGYASVDVNDTPLVMPQTGSVGSLFIRIIGCVLLTMGVAVLAALAYLIYRKKRTTK